jgi:hypothetical protein
MSGSYIAQYAGLPGIADGRAEGPMANSPTGMVRTLGAHRATSAAADHGALMAWIDDAGAYRGAFSRWGSTQAATETRSKSALQQWLKAWWPAMRDPHFTAPESGK